MVGAGTERVKAMIEFGQHAKGDPMAEFVPPPSDKLDALCRHWKITKLTLFGSQARGDARPDSDVDLLVEYAPDADWSLLDIARLHEAMATLFGRPVDLVRERNVTNPYRLASIRRHRMLLYERGGQAGL